MRTVPADSVTLTLLPSTLAVSASFTPALIVRPAAAEPVSVPRVASAVTATS